MMMTIMMMKEMEEDGEEKKIGDNKIKEASKSRYCKLKLKQVKTLNYSAAAHRFTFLLVHRCRADKSPLQFP